MRDMKTEERLRMGKKTNHCLSARYHYLIRYIVPLADIHFNRRMKFRDYLASGPSTRRL